MVLLSAFILTQQSPFMSKFEQASEIVKDGKSGAVQSMYAKSQTWLVTKQQQPQKDTSLTGLGALSLQFELTLTHDICNLSDSK